MTKIDCSSKHKKQGLAVAALSLCLCAGLQLTQTTFTPASAASGHNEDENLLRSQAAEYARAYAAGDAATLAAMWATDGSMTDGDGDEHRGRPAIEQYFREDFHRNGGQMLEVNVETLKFPAADVAVEEGTTRVASGPYMGNIGRYLVVHTKESGKWLMQSVSETACAAKSNYEYLKDLNWLVGNWSFKEGDREIHMKTEWSKNKTFIVSRFTSGNGDGPVEQMEVIGWDPLKSRINTWHFNTKGGFGSGELGFDGKCWTERAGGLQADGTEDSARYTITKLDDNTFTWQSTKRREGRQILPDSKLLTVSRDIAH